MARIDVLMPQMGESIAEGTLSKWLKRLGDEVKRDEPLFEISTDKVDAEIPAPAAGKLVEIKVQEGQTVPVQTLVAVLETDKNAAVSAPTAPKAEPAPKPAAPKPEPPKATAPAPAPAAPAVAAARPPDRPTAQVGKGGDGGVETAAHVAGCVEGGYSRSAERRAKHKAAYAERRGNLTYLACIAKVGAGQLRAHAVVNAAVSGDTIIYRRDINIGVAVALEWGLVV